MAVGILKQMDSSPLRIRRAVELQAVIQECQSWHSAVMEALQAEAMISLKKVESFINDGERLPFQYNTVSFHVIRIIDNKNNNNLKFCLLFTGAGSIKGAPITSEGLAR